MKIEILEQIRRYERDALDDVIDLVTNRPSLFMAKDALKYISGRLVDSSLGTFYAHKLVNAGIWRVVLKKNSIKIYRVSETSPDELIIKILDDLIEVKMK